MANTNIVIVNVNGTTVLQDREKEIRKDYRRVQPGTIRKETTGIHAGKLSVEIVCARRACKEVRRVATSDLHQVTCCETCTKILRAERRRERRNGTKKVKAKARKTRKVKREPVLVGADA